MFMGNVLTGIVSQSIITLLNQLPNYHKDELLLLPVVYKFNNIGF